MDKATLRQFLECPVCFRLPRGVNVVVCSQGHSLCSRCFDRLHKKVCPQGRCAFSDPPMRNRTAEAMMEEAKFDVPCKNADDGCGFEGPRSKVERHEAACAMGKVACIEGGSCSARVFAVDMADHLRSHHSNVVFLEAGENNTSTQKWLLKKRQHLAKATCYWNTVVWRIKDHQLAIRFFKREGIWYSFVVVFGDDSEAAGLSCEVSIPGREGYLYLGNVHSVRETVESIIHECSCLALPNDVVRDLVSSKDISAGSVRAGFDGQLTVSYSVVAGQKKGNKRRPSQGITDRRK